MKYFIWDFERGMWWKSNSRGYTKDVNEAGRYGQERAVSICTSSNLFLEKGKIELAMVPATNFYKQYKQRAKQ